MSEKRSKYNAKKSTFDGITFDSAVECDYYKFLLGQKKKGKVIDIKLQPKYEIIEKVANFRATNYVADFEVKLPGGHITVIDIKGMATDTAKIKRKLFMVKYPNVELLWLCKAPKYHADDTGEEWIEYDQLNKLRSKRKKLKQMEDKEK